MAAPSISIVVPTYNRAEGIDALLASIERHSDGVNVEVIVNDDKRTNDATPDVIDRHIANGLDVRYLQENTSRSRARTVATEYAHAPIVLHLDSDMEVTAELLRECVDLISEGNDALVIPEESFGTNFWAKCRGLEKNIYDGVAFIESARCFRKDLYEKVGGHTPDLVFSEDKDLDLRVRATGARVGRTKAALLHNEGAPTLMSILKKKGAYAGDAARYSELHPDHLSLQVSITNRLRVLFGKPKLIVRHPCQFIGLIVIGAAEFVGYKLGNKSTASSDIQRQHSVGARS